MDTGTHVVMGIALGGLATLDPVVSNDPVLFQACMIGTVLGSQAPDFDTILKLRNNAIYIRHHRGETHSVPAIIFWGITISAIIHIFVPQVNFYHLWAWTFLAVFIHVLVDTFNAYGTQAYRPFSNKWVAHGFINTFDPVIFSLHLLGILLWLIGTNPGITRLTIYFIIFLYYIKRYIDKRRIITQIKSKYVDVEEIVTSPTMKQKNWRVAITTKEYFYVGTIKNNHLTMIDTFKKIPVPNTKMICIAKKDENISAFLSFSPVYRWEVNEYDNYTEVRFIDLRYRSKEHYPFVAVVQIDASLEIVGSYTGWVFSEKKLQSKLMFGDHLT